jgi:hypothetical protein
MNRWLLGLVVVGCGGDVAPCAVPECELVAQYTCGCAIERCDGALRVVVSDDAGPHYFDGVEYPTVDDAVLVCGLHCGTLR